MNKKNKDILYKQAFSEFKILKKENIYHLKVFQKFVSDYENSKDFYRFDVNKPLFHKIVTNYYKLSVYYIEIHYLNYLLDKYRNKSVVITRSIIPDILYLLKIINSALYSRRYKYDNIMIWIYIDLSEYFKELEPELNTEVYNVYDLISMFLSNLYMPVDLSIPLKKNENDSIISSIDDGLVKDLKSRSAQHYDVNQLCTSKYLFPEIHYGFRDFIRKGFTEKKLYDLPNNSIIYMINFNIVYNGRKPACLIYNYIKYPVLLGSCLLFYISAFNKNNYKCLGLDNDNHLFICDTDIISDMPKTLSE